MSNFLTFFWLLLCLLSKKNHPLFLTGNVTSWVENQAKLNEKHMTVANTPVLVTGNTNIKVPVYLKLQLRRRPGR